MNTKKNRGFSQKMYSQFFLIIILKVNLDSLDYLYYKVHEIK